jgi:hypothetical protein
VFLQVGPDCISVSWVRLGQVRLLKTSSGWISRTWVWTGQSSIGQFGLNLNPARKVRFMFLQVKLG